VTVGWQRREVGGNDRAVLPDPKMFRLLHRWEILLPVTPRHTKRANASEHCAGESSAIAGVQLSYAVASANASHCAHQCST